MTGTGRRSSARSSRAEGACRCHARLQPLRARVVNIRLLHNSGVGRDNFTLSRSVLSRRRFRALTARLANSPRTGTPDNAVPTHRAPLYRHILMTDAVPDFPTRQRDPRARDGRRRSGEERPSRHADGHGRDRRRAVAAAISPQPGAIPKWAESRPLRALQRSRLDAAVRAAASHRLRPADRRDQALPPAALEDARPSGGGPHAGCRNDDGSARPGTRQRRRHGASPNGCSPREFNRPGHDDRRPSHVRASSATAA